MSETTYKPEEEKLLIPENNIDSFLQLRKDFIVKVNAICVEGKDFHVIQGKKSLAKGGAEKIANIFSWNAQFIVDTAVLNLITKADDTLIPFICTLSKNGAFIGEGRGAASLKKNNSDLNKTIKMAQKSAYIDAVLRSSGLSDFFTQDLEDMNLPAAESEKTNVLPDSDGKHPSQPQLKRLFAISKSLDLSADAVKELMIVRYGIEHSADLTIEQYNELCGDEKKGVLSLLKALKDGAINTVTIPRFPEAISLTNNK